MTGEIANEGKPTTSTQNQGDADVISFDRTETDILGESPATENPQKDKATMEVQNSAKGMQGSEDHREKADVDSEAKCASFDNKDTWLTTVETTVDLSVEEFMSVEVQGDGESSDNDSESNHTSVKGKNTIREVRLGPLVFTSSLDMFNFFYNLLQEWPLSLNLNKYEHLMLEELIRKGHPFQERVFDKGIKAFQIRVNDLFHSRSYYIVHDNGSLEEFSYRNCIDNVFPLPRIYSALSRKKIRLGRQPMSYDRVRL